MKVDNQKALIIIDYINDIAHPKGKIAKSAPRIKENKIIEKLNKVIEHAREQELLIIFVKVGFNKSYVECPRHSPVFSTAPKYKALELDSWGTEFLDNLNVKNSDCVVIKKRINAFYGTDLEAILKAQNIKHIFLAGTSTNMAIESTARDAHDRDYQVTIISDCCEAFTKEIHEASLINLERIAYLIKHHEF